MKKFTFKYPGDTPVDCIKYNRQEFLDMHPRKPTEIWNASGLVESIPIPKDMILCDFCNQDPGDEIWVVSNSRAYCRECAERYVLKYCVPNPNDAA